MEHKKIMGIIMMLLLLWTTGCSTEGNEAAENEIDTMATELNIVYETISPEWPLYGAADELIDASDKIILGTVTDVSFQMIDIRTGKSPEGEADELYCYL